MKNKVIPLFNKQKMVQNNGVKYSSLLENFLEPFANEFKNVEYMEDIFEFAIQAWNFGNLQIILPENKNESLLNSIEEDEIDVDLLKRMIDYKVSDFSEYTNFIVDFECEKTKEEPVLTVVTQEQDDYFGSMFEHMDHMEEMNRTTTQDDFEENYIDRTAIIIKTKKPFIDWANKLYPGDSLDEYEINTYLIDENQDVETWLKKKFDKIFEIELEAVHLNKKDWPQNRTFKMFNEWFHVETSTIIYDLEKAPVSKRD